MSSPPPIDQAARERIVSELDENLCVEAGAGTGKTTMLVRRVVALLRTGRTTIDELAVITFTEKAAGELSVRLRFELEAAAAAAEDAGERTLLRAALAGLHRARVQTIHAFASGILRERPVEAALDPQFETLDDLEGELRFDERYRRWLDELLGTATNEVERAFRRGMEMSDLRAVAEGIHRHRGVLPLAPIEAPPADVAGHQAWAAQAAARLDAVGPTCSDISDGAYAQIEVVAAHLSELASLDEVAAERVVLFETPSVKLNVGRAGNWTPGEGCADVKSIFRELRERSDELIGALRVEALVGLIPHAERFAAEYAADRRTAGLAEFDDLLIWARDLVRDHPRVRAHFQDRTTHILVDEFQDTDPVQAELVVWLATVDAKQGADWRELNPTPGRLFVVGDPKQSIYRFRRADVATYDLVKGGPLGGRLAELVQSFRTTEALLAWINTAFDRVLVENPGVQVANARLAGRPTPLDAALDRPSVIVAHSELPDKPNAAASRDEEARLIAGILSRAVRDEAWPVRGASAEVRAARWGDCAILMPARTPLSALEAALQAAGVEYRVDAGRGLYARQEIRDAISVLGSIDDPADEIAAVAALRSLAFGCSDLELLQWKQAGHRFDLRLDWNSAEPPEIAQALLLLRGLYRAQRSLSLGELVRLTFQETGMIDAALTLPAGDQAAANLLKLVDIARAFSAAGGGALRAFTNWLERQRDENVEGTDAPVAEETDDRVRVLTIHAAKGLEFPIVALAGLAYAGRNDKEPIPDAENHRIHVPVGPGNRAFRTPGWDDADAHEKAMLAAERDRLMYVASTRARDHLIVPFTYWRTSGAVGASLAPTLPETSADQVADCWTYPVERLAGMAPAGGTAANGEPDEAAIDRLRSARDDWDARWLDDMRRLRAGIEVRNASSVKAEPRPLVADADSGGGGDAPVDTGLAPPRDIGDALHRVLELVDLPDAVTLEAVAEAVCLEHGLNELTAEVVEMARRCLASPPVRAAELLHREVPFVRPLQGGDVLVGRIDAVAEDGTVMDFKTDLVEHGVVLDGAEHRGQLEAYRDAVAAARRAAPGHAWVVMARTGEAGRI